MEVVGFNLILEIEIIELYIFKTEVLEFEVQRNDNVFVCNHSSLKEIEARLRSLVEIEVGNKTTINLLVGGLAGNRIGPPPPSRRGSYRALPTTDAPVVSKLFVSFYPLWPCRRSRNQVSGSFAPASFSEQLFALVDLKDLLFDMSNLENEDSDLFGFISNLENPKGVLEHSRKFKDEATSLILNMAASLLKKKEFEHVGHLCSIVLNYNPNNVKTLFRRANAAIGLGEYELAYWDLRVVLEVEPSNQEVVKKLKEVE
ncbi:Peptidyl-prolyl cis-trans isomerase FKBP65 [Bienertia sinuspersici]